MYRYANVDCRIGSLEISRTFERNVPSVDCRIGSLEICHEECLLHAIVDCRIGSLEMTDSPPEITA